VLQISSYWREGEAVVIDLLPDHDVAALLREGRRTRPKAEAQTVLAEILPARLARALADRLLPAGQLGNVADRAIDAAVAALKAWHFVPSGTEGYAKAEVTVGGIDTAGLSSQTMAARAVPGLYVIGEAVDVTGWLGGYNFQWAWSSGWCAGMAV
jgi:predicted Rossmann fold flavoprotein